MSLVICDHTVLPGEQSSLQSYRKSLNS